MSDSSPDMYDYILQSKDCARHIIENRESIFKEAVEYFLKSGIEQIYLIGSGTSYHAHFASRRLMERFLNMKVFVSYPVPFTEGEKIFNKKTLVMGSSHAGRSSSTIMGLDAAREAGLFTIASTATRDGLLVKHADAKLYCEIGDEKAGPKTKGYIGAIVTNLVFALEIAVRQGKMQPNERDAYYERILKSTDNIPGIAETTSAWYKSHADELKKSRRLVIIGYDNNIASYMEGTLKILEAVRYSVSGYEMEEFMHGIYHSIWENDYMFYLGSKGREYPRLLRLKKYFEERTKHNFMFTADKTIDDGRNCIINFVDDPDFSFLEYVVPLQVIARRLSADLGIDCNISSDPDFHRKMESYRF